MTKFRWARPLTVVAAGLLVALVLSFTTTQSNTAPAGAAPAVNSASPTVASYYYANTTDPDQMLTATYNAGATGAAWVVALHGGSWSGGTQTNAQNAVNTFSAAGFQVFNVAYRLISDADPGETAVPWAEQKQDVLDAIAWIRTHAAQFGIDPNRGAVYGFSAGGHLAAIAGLSGDGDNGIRAIVSASGVLQPQRLWEDMDGDHPGEPATNFMKSLAGWAAVATGCPYPAHRGSCMQHWASFDPASYISPHDPAVLMFAGLADPVVPHQMTQAFQRSLNTGQIPNQLVLVPGVSHNEITALDHGPRQKMVIDFLRSRTAVAAAPATATVTGHATAAVTNAQHATVAVRVNSSHSPDGGSVHLAVGTYHGAASVRNGVTSLRLPALTPGTHNVFLKYEGTRLTQTATATVVLHVQRVTPTMNVTTTPDPLRAGQLQGSKLVVTVHAAVGVTSPAKVRLVSARGVVVAQAPIQSGRALIAMPRLAAGWHHYTVRFAGTSTVASSSKAVVISVSK